MCVGALTSVLDDQFHCQPRILGRGTVLYVAYQEQLFWAD